MAKQQLENQSFTVYLPLFKTMKHKKDKWLETIEVLFPGYLFIQIDIGKDNIAPIRSTRGVRGLMRFGQLLVPMPDDVIKQLQLDEARQHKQNQDVSAQFKKGEKVGIVGGPFKGVDAVYDIPRSADRVMVLINILGRQKPVAVDINHIVAH